MPIASPLRRTMSLRCDAGPMPKKALPRDAQGLPTAKVYAPRRLQHSAGLHTSGSEIAADSGDGRGRRDRPRREVRAGGGSDKPPRVRKQGKEMQVRELQRLVVSGGAHRGRRLVTPAVYMRPMMSRVREALFSMLYPTGILRESAATLDLFSGSGVVGIEALSRGIGRATFVDFSPVCTEVIRSNCESLDESKSVNVIEADVYAVLNSPERFGLGDRVFEMVTVTPPYEEVIYSDLMSAIAGSRLVGEDTLVVIEYPVELGIFPQSLFNGQLVGLRNRKYGRTVLALYVNRPSGKLDLPPFTEEFVSFGKK